MKIEFDNIPAVGLALRIAGQRFDLVDVVPRQTVSGNTAHDLIWLAECATCGVVFRAASSQRRLPEIKRCELHKSPGKKVR